MGRLSLGWSKLDALATSRKSGVETEGLATSSCFKYVRFHLVVTDGARDDTRLAGRGRLRLPRLVKGWL